MHRPALVLAAVLSLTLGSGCQTIETYENPDYEGSPIYSGTRKDLSYMGQGLLNFSTGIFLLGLADLPLSFVADTFVLPSTIPKSRARVGVRTDKPRVDREVDSPVQFGENDTDPKQIATRLFEVCSERTEKLVPEITDCYSIDARIELREQTRDTIEVISGAEYKTRIRESLPRIRHLGDFITYRNIEYLVQGEAVRVTAERATAFSPNRVPVSFMIARCADGQWRIVEESGPGWP